MRTRCVVVTWLEYWGVSGESFDTAFLSSWRSWSNVLEGPIQYRTVCIYLTERNRQGLKDKGVIRVWQKLRGLLSTLLDLKKMIGNLTTQTLHDPKFATPLFSFKFLDTDFTTSVLPLLSSKQRSARSRVGRHTIRFQPSYLLAQLPRLNRESEACYSHLASRFPGLCF